MNRGHICRTCGTACDGKLYCRACWDVLLQALRTGVFVPPEAVTIAERERQHRDGILRELARVKSSGERYRNGTLIYDPARLLRSA